MRLFQVVGFIKYLISFFIHFRPLGLIRITTQLLSGNDKKTREYEERKCREKPIIPHVFTCQLVIFAFQELLNTCSSTEKSADSKNITKVVPTSVIWCLVNSYAVIEETPYECGKNKETLY